MSCEGHRQKYFEQLQEEGEDEVGQLEGLYQSARNQVDEDLAEMVELKTRLLFTDMQNRGIKPPTHSSTGLPKKSARYGYAAVYDRLKGKGYFARRAGEAKPKPKKTEPMPPEKYKKLAEAQAAPARPAETPPVEGVPVLTAAQEAEVIETAKPGLNLVGLTEEDVPQAVERFPIWQYIPRCAKCGRWMSPHMPICRNPKCGLAGKKQREPIGWPPFGANFKRARPNLAPDYMALERLPRADIVIRKNGEEKTVQLESITTEDGQVVVEYSEMLGGRVPVKGMGKTVKSNVVSWVPPATPGAPVPPPTVAPDVPAAEPDAFDALGEPDALDAPAAPDALGALGALDAPAALDADADRQVSAILQQNGLIEQDGKIVADPHNPEAALVFIAQLRDAARKADQQADAATPSKASKLRQNARGARKDADRIEGTLFPGASIPPPTPQPAIVPDVPAVAPEAPDALDALGAPEALDAVAGMDARWQEEDDGWEEASARQEMAEGGGLDETEAASVQIWNNLMAEGAAAIGQAETPPASDPFGTMDQLAALLDQALTESQGRCPRCGGFLDAELNCNNPQCPSNTGQDEQVETPIAEGGSDDTIATAIAAGFVNPEMAEMAHVPAFLAYLDERGLLKSSGEFLVDGLIADAQRAGVIPARTMAAIDAAWDNGKRLDWGYYGILDYLNQARGEPGRCRACGAFLGDDGICNNPNCPSNTGQGEQVEIPIAEGVALVEAGFEEVAELPEETFRAIPPDWTIEVERRPHPFVNRDYYVVWQVDGDQKSPLGMSGDTPEELRDKLAGPQGFGTRSVEVQFTDNIQGEELAALQTALARCDLCGAFIGKDEVCQNPNCPTNSGAAETDSIPVEIPIAEGVALMGEKFTSPDEAPPAEPVEEAAPREDVIDEAEALDLSAKPTGHDYRITEYDEIGLGGPKAKARGNVEAIRLLKLLEAEGRLATPEEQAVLVKFVGWGSLPQVFDYKNQYADENGYYSGHNRNREKLPFYEEWKELKELLSEEEFQAASRSTVNAHYTSKTVVKGIWAALQHMGFDRPDAAILEPASGVGHFFGLMPDEFKNSARVGIELDAMTAGLAKHLYQNADMRHSGFEDAQLPNDFFDLAISNVPFGNYAVSDREFQGTRKRLASSIHNFFFAKSLDKVKPGGTVAFITSRYTLDGKDPTIRQYLAEHADLVAAIRLPNTAFKENAGTEVTTDVIFLRKRLPGETPQDLSWVDTEEITTEAGDAIRINKHFAKNPGMVLGKLARTGSMYGNQEVTVESDGREIGQALQDAIAQLPREALIAPHGRCAACGSFLDKNEACNNPRCPKNHPVETRRSLPQEAGMVSGQYVVREDGVYRVEAGALIPHEKSGKTTASGEEAMELRRIRGMVAVNAAARQVLRLNVEDAGAEALTAAQDQLNAEYDAFAAKFGPITSKANQRALSGDPALPFLLALETDYNAETGTAKKEAIFSKRVIAVSKEVEHADSPEDALRVALNETGLVNWERMAELTGQTPEQLQKALRRDGVVFMTPDGQWATAEEYLSGNVRQKLREAEAAASVNPAFAGNVTALQAAVPRDLEAHEIKATLGSGWIPPEDVGEFASEMFRGAKFQVAYLKGAAEWSVKPAKTSGWGREVFKRDGTENMQAWGTKRMEGLKLLTLALNGQDATVYDKFTEGDQEKRVVNQDATIAAREQQAKIKKAFEDWIFEDEERAARLVPIYNELFNSEVPRDFNGSHLTMPGLGAAMPELRAHQKDAVWRISQGQTTLLAHMVGSGKSFAMIGGSMELRRIGMRKKPLHAIPNHMLEQYSADFYRMYPSAKLLALSADDLGEKRRAETLSRIATGDWDAVIVTHSALGKLPMHPQAEVDFLNEQIGDLREALEAARLDEDNKMTLKQLEKKLANEEAKLKNKILEAQAHQDSTGTVTWEDLGVDQLFLDEADLFKNLDFATRRTRLAGVQGQASTRAQDLFMKIRSMKKRFGDNQSVVFATGTPIANSISEMYNMQRFLDYDYLKDKGMSHFDAWATQFGDVVTSIEMDPTGGGYRTKSRFATFNNVPELKRMFMRFADVQVDWQALKLKRPKLAEDAEGNRRPKGVSVEASDDLQDYIQTLVERAEKLKEVSPREDNMLKITSDGRKAALDMRLVDPLAPDYAGSKINQAVEKIHGIYAKTTGIKITADDETHNMAQMVFCDLGTPSGAKDGSFNLYDDIKRKLVARGVKPEEIAFMQDYKEDDDKFELFQRVNAGQVRVLIGSTETMGAGTNAQKRMAALHHLDAPWRPRDVEQREGRILRQGNLNDEIEIYRYLTEGSFDVYNWQLLERKARFIAQVMNRDLGERSVEDIDSQALSYAEMKALATGNPAVIEKVAVDAELRKLRALEGSHRQRTHEYRGKLTSLPEEIARTEAAYRRSQAALERVQQAQAAEQARETAQKERVESLREQARLAREAAKTDTSPTAQAQAETAKTAWEGVAERFKRNGGFTMRVQGRAFEERDEAGQRLANLESDLLRSPKAGGTLEEVGEYQGFPLLAEHPAVVGGLPKFYLKVTDEEAQLIPTPAGERTFAPDNPLNNVARLKRALDMPARHLAERDGKLTSLRSEYEAVQHSAGGAFEHQARLDELLVRSKELDATLAALQKQGGGQAAAE